MEALPSVCVPRYISSRIFVDPHLRVGRGTHGLLPRAPPLPSYHPWETNNCTQDKKVAIIHGRDLLLNDQFPDKFRKLVNQKLEARGIELILGDYVATFPENDGGEIVFRSGKKLHADLVVRTSSPCSSNPHKLSLTGLGNCLPRSRRTVPSQTPLGYPTPWARTHYRPRVS